jgi:hypothetical protein
MALAEVLNCFVCDLEHGTKPAPIYDGVKASFHQ